MFIININFSKFSTGFITILNYFLKYPDEEIILLGFYQKGNRSVVKEGGVIRQTFYHNFDDEKIIIRTLVPKIIFIN